MTDKPNERTAIPKLVRFEVFKRDKFTCQYCGAKAPDVLLECDHIHPVAEGGTNEMLNLVTACNPCNNGKGARLLSENSAVEKQRSQMEALQDRREQLEMMIAWRDSLDREHLDEMEVVCARVETVSHGSFSPSEQGRDRLRRWLKRYGIEELLRAIDDAFEIYLKFDGDEVVDESSLRAFQKIGWALWTNRQLVEKPYINRLLYIQGICRNRFQTPRDKYLDYLEAFIIAGMSVDELEQISLVARGWQDMVVRLQEWHRSHNPGDPDIELEVIDE